MARTEKGTRTRHLPPRVQLQVRGNGSTTVGQPTTVNRVHSTGQQPLAFDDTASVDFLTGSFLNLPSGLPSGSRYLSSELTTTMVVSGAVRIGVADEFVRAMTFSSESFQPFVDHSNPACDARAPSSGSDNSFYAIGSLIDKVGDGFDQPLWSKTKFEIGITPSADHSFGIQNNVGTPNNYLMAYWNKDTGRYEGIGSGKEFSQYTATGSVGLLTFLREKAVGFGASLDNNSIPGGIESASFLIGNPISTFGFPNTSQFVATSSNLFQLDRFISEPFLVEKVVLYFSGALNLHQYNSDTLRCMTTFFVLNQRQGYVKQLDQTINYNSGAVERGSLSTSSVGLTTTRDLVTWLQLSNIVVGQGVYSDGLLREHNYTSQSSANQFSGQLVVSGTAKSAFSYTDGFRVILNKTSTASLNTSEYIESLEFSGRNLISDYGRGWLSSWENPEIFGSVTFSGEWVPTFNTTANKRYSKYNPYLLLPTDQLILGWQVPYSEYAFHMNAFDALTYNGIGPHLSASTGGVHKVVFYGSLLRDNKEYHDSFEQATPASALNDENV